MASPSEATVFVGGGNMAAAMVGGLLASGRDPNGIAVVEPDGARRGVLAARFGIRAFDGAAAAAASVAQASLVVWAVKPQVFADAARPLAGAAGDALHLSIMAGVRVATIAAATGSDRVVRAMPNTPALVGRGIAGLYASRVVDAAGRDAAEAVLASTGECVWVDSEEMLDAVTALSGSGPAYAFLLVEAMLEAARVIGLPDADARRLAVQTVAGAAALAAASAEPVETLRRNVTSPGGTTAAAVAVLEARGVKRAFVEAIVAARDRARELGG